MYYIYMLRCEDNSIYTGITNHLERRMQEHFLKTKECAKYTKRHTPVKIEKVWTCENRILASKLEYRIKKLTKQEKEDLIKQEKKFLILFQDSLECKNYKLFCLKNDTK